MLTIRLSRVGRRGAYAYRVVLQDHHRPVKGKAMEVLGHYNPAQKDKPVELKRDRIEYWVSVGARPSDSAATLFKKNDMKNMDQFIGTRDRKRKKKGEQPEENIAETPKTEEPAVESAETPPAPESAEVKADEPKPEEAEPVPTPAEEQAAPEATTEEAQAEEPKEEAAS